MDEEFEPNEIADLLAPFWTLQRTAEALGIAVGELERRTASGSVLGLVPEGGAAHYPVWQFRRRPDGVVEVKPAFASFIGVLHGSANPWSIVILLRTPASELGDMTPEEWDRSGGNSAGLTELARLLASEWKR
ncbi:MULTISPECIES: hypothetical protein [unclassified Nocardioides]|uniref:hypothetical protein n=1 Tax=unclassified Nocardioides TaxID=2615069 RepID=UPI0012E3BCFA|nr:MULTISPECIES: hypothetical protein [unclassified Nocardioides]